MSASMTLLNLLSKFKNLKLENKIYVIIIKMIILQMEC